MSGAAFQTGKKSSGKYLLLSVLCPGCLRQGFSPQHDDMISGFSSLLFLSGILQEIQNVYI